MEITSLLPDGCAQQFCIEDRSGTAHVRGDTDEYVAGKN